MSARDLIVQVNTGPVYMSSFNCMTVCFSCGFTYDAYVDYALLHDKFVYSAQQYLKHCADMIAIATTFEE